MNKTFTIAEEFKSTRLDHFLVKQIPDVSRSQIQKLITNGKITVNKKKVAKHYFLSVGDEVIVYIPEKDEKVEKTIPEIPVVYEDDAVMVIDKPAGIVVHAPHEHYPHATVVDFLLQHDPKIAEVGEDVIRAGIVHRLDKDVSGVMVIAKTPDAYASLKKQFMERKVHKAYRAIVYGTPAQSAGEIKFKIAHSQTISGKMAARPEHEEGRDAWTEYTVLKTYKRYALLAVQIKTGRTHQIRAHLAAIDHPVVGDRLYFSKRYQPSTASQRLYLHASELAFTHPVTGKELKITAEIPKEFVQFMNA